MFLGDFGCSLSVECLYAVCLSVYFCLMVCLCLIQLNVFQTGVDI